MSPRPQLPASGSGSLKVYIPPPMLPISRRSGPGAARVVLLSAVLGAPACGGAMREPGSVAVEPGRLPVSHLTAAAPKLEGDFAARLSAADPARHVVALVDLTDQLDLRELSHRLDAMRPAKQARREAIVGALERVAERQQAQLRPFLDALLAEGSVTYARPVAVVNRIVVEATPDALRRLAARDEVAMVRPDWSSERVAVSGAGAQDDAAAPLGPAFPSWAPASIGADKLWARGIDGRGVVVATIDTGAYEEHEQLAGRRVPGDAGWLDPVEGSSQGTDHHGHGTGVLSEAVGGNPGGRTIGIAPGARWAAALGNWRNYYSRSRMTLAADWILRVARPDVLVNAWSHDEGTCSDFDRPFIDAWKASGIFVVFPAGNGGPEPRTGESPAQLAGIFPDGGPVFSVGALDRWGQPARISSRGPSRCGSPAFPSLAAPGSDLPMAALDGPRAYARGDGTSLSAGLVGGAAALLLQAAPETDPETLQRVLLRTARDVRPDGRDDATGAGAIDVEAALAALTGRTAR